jgi:Haem-NO-binding
MASLNNMYGLVNRAIEQMVCEQHGDERWEEIKSAAGVETELFIANEGYDDAITYQLVGAASRVLGVPAEKILQAFGRHWVLRTAKEGYGAMLKSVGNDVGEFLENLPHLHARVKLIYPHLEPPRFTSEREGGSSLLLHYRSSREGLAPFVCGLLFGIGELFSTEVNVTHQERKGDGADHDVFLISWAPPA